MLHGLEHPCGQLESAVLAVSPPRFLCMPSLLTGRPVQEARIDAMIALLSNNKSISLLSTLFSAQIQNTIPYQPL